jgi:hypothetical protein
LSRPRQAPGGVNRAMMRVLWEGGPRAAHRHRHRRCDRACARTGRDGTQASCACAHGHGRSRWRARFASSARLDRPRAPTLALLFSSLVRPLQCRCLDHGSTGAATSFALVNALRFRRSRFRSIDGELQLRRPSLSNNHASYVLATSCVLVPLSSAT